MTNSSRTLLCFMLVFTTLSACRSSSENMKEEQAVLLNDVSGAIDEEEEVGGEGESMTRPPIPQGFVLQECASASEALSGSLDRAMRVDVEVSKLVNGEEEVVSRPAIITTTMQPFTVAFESEDATAQKIFFDASWMLWRDEEKEDRLAMIGEVALRGADDEEAGTLAVGECVAGFGPLSRKTFQTSDGTTFFITLALTPHPSPDAS